MVVIKRRTLVIAFTLFIVALFTATCVAFTNRTIYDTRICVVIDAGHGGVDGGASGTVSGINESDINLAVAKLLEDRLIACDINVVMTRENSDGLYDTLASGYKRRDMEKRKEIIEEAVPNMVVSIHMNKISLESCSGAQVFYAENSENGKVLAENIQTSLNNNIEFERPRNVATGDFYMLTCSQYTSVLVECGFLSNAKEEALLITESYQETLAQHICDGIMAYFNV